MPLAAGGRWDAYLTSWTATGALRWSKSWGGSGDDLCKGVAVNQDLDVFAAGGFQQAVLFDGQQRRCCHRGAGMALANAGWALTAQPAPGHISNPARR